MCWMTEQLLPIAPMLRICVTGGRDGEDRELVKAVLSQFLGQNVYLAHGGATGYDTLCAEFACANGWPVKCYEADWKAYGKAAGHIRNSYMLQDFKPDILISFPGGNGTRDCTQKAIDKSIRVMYASNYKEKQND